MIVFALFFTRCGFASLPMYCVKLARLKNRKGWDTYSFFTAKRDGTGDLAFAIFVRDTVSKSLLEYFYF